MRTRAEMLFNELGLGEREPASVLEIMFTSMKKKRQKDEERKLNIIHGIEIGLLHSSLEGQRLEAYHNVKNPRHKEFLDKFYALAGEYECAMQFHPRDGMCVIDRSFKWE